MACGIPLDVLDPVSVVDNDHGQYGSYNLAEYSEDGTEDAETLLGHWSGTAPLAPDHGFTQICRFIRARPRGIQRSADLLDFAVDYLAQQGHSLIGLRKMEDVPAFVNALPKGEAAHVLAYVWNRELCFQLYRTASKKIYYQEGEGRDARRALIDTRLPKWQAKEILSRLQG
jgi:hypothetical protein